MDVVNAAGHPRPLHQNASAVGGRRYRAGVRPGRDGAAGQGALSPRPRSSPERPGSPRRPSESRDYWPGSAQVARLGEHERPADGFTGCRVDHSGGGPGRRKAIGDDAQGVTIAAEGKLRPGRARLVHRDGLADSAVPGRLPHLDRPGPPRDGQRLSVGREGQAVDLLGVRPVLTTWHRLAVGKPQEPHPVTGRDGRRPALRLGGERTDGFRVFNLVDRAAVSTETIRTRLGSVSMTA